MKKKTRAASVKQKPAGHSLCNHSLSRGWPDTHSKPPPARPPPTAASAGRPRRRLDSDDAPDLEEPHLLWPGDEVWLPVVRKLDGEQHPNEVRLAEEEEAKDEEDARLCPADAEASLVEGAVLADHPRAPLVEHLVRDQPRAALGETIKEDVAGGARHGERLEVVDGETDRGGDLGVGEGQVRHVLEHRRALAAPQAESHLVAAGGESLPLVLVLGPQVRLVDEDGAVFPLGAPLPPAEHVDDLEERGRLVLPEGAPPPHVAHALVRTFFEQRAQDRFALLPERPHAISLHHDVERCCSCGGRRLGGLDARHGLRCHQ
mmetsp:Transcript_21422/g.68421  ORF Transcript_21422/g.68421 Transcript_21422/m.68421 type:complete len:318 (-) Transcript_21422:116-1069(-)